jgi:hypothetical protein
MLISKFEKIKMLEDETFNDFYTKINDLRNSMESLWKKVSDAKIIKNILWSLPECFRIKVTTIEESKDLKSMKIEEFVGSLQTYEYSLPLVKKEKTIALKASKKKARVSSHLRKTLIMKKKMQWQCWPKNFGRLMKNEKFKKKFTEKLKKAPRKFKPEEAKKKVPKGPRCFECSGFGYMRADYGNLKQAKGKAYNATLSDELEEEEETPGMDQKFLAFVAPCEDQEYYQSYNSKTSNGDREELKEAYKNIYINFLILR